ncbi:OIT3 [Branchiostoma lanceolatum]|uniref:OIT3 protein n=1 Tax=Branchiostoma lanceolatum TaxID=7740 RepID=A0A8J9VWU9_BRALA|nr:OIT3 [Branchiostoma lanceolatum]
MEALRVLGPSAEDNEVIDDDTLGDDGDTEGTDGGTEGTDGDTEETEEDAEGTDGDTEGTDGDTEGTDEDAEGTDGDTEETEEDAEGTDGDVEGTDGDTEETEGDADGTDGDTEETDGDVEGTDGDTEETEGDTEETDGDTEETEGDPEGTDGDTEETEGDPEGTDGDTEETEGDAEGTDGDTEGTDGDTEETEGDAEGTDGDTEGTDGDTEETKEDADGTDGDTEGTDGDTEETEEDTEGTDGDTEGTDGDILGTDGDTEGTDGDTEGTDGDAEGTDGDTEETDGDTEGTDGDTEGTDGDTEETDGDTEGTDEDILGGDEETEDTDGDIGDTEGPNEDAEANDKEIGDTDVGTHDTTGDTSWSDEDIGVFSTETAENRGQESEDFENIVRTLNEKISGQGAVADGLVSQSRRQNSGPHAFEILRTANQQYRGINFFVIKARLPADGLSVSENWCRDYQRLCAQYGLRPTGCGEQFAINNGHYASCRNEYNSDPYINNVLGCNPSGGVAAVANLAFSAGSTSSRSFGFHYCTTNTCQRRIAQSSTSLSYTGAAFPNGDGIVYTVCKGSAGPHAFEILRTANQQYRGINFFVIKARLPADGLSVSENWCRDYQRLCAQYGSRPTGCGEQFAINNGHYASCRNEYNSDPYINNVLNCNPSSGVAAVANLAFSAGATSSRSFGFHYCTTNTCQRRIAQSSASLSYTGAAFPNGDRIVYTVCKGSAGPHAFEILRTANQQYRGIGFFVIKARLPADGLSVSENWCRDYQRLCAQYGLRPTGCGEAQANSGYYARCRTEYNSDPYINNVLSCNPSHRVAAVANLAFSAGATSTRSFGFHQCHPSYCRRRIDQSIYGLYRTSAAYPNGDRIVYTVCKGSADACTNYILPNGTFNNPCVNGDCVDGGDNYTCNCRAGYHGDTCNKAYVPVSELSAATTCTNDYMELSIPEDQLTDINLNNLHWEPDQSCAATTNGTHFLFRTRLYGCGTRATFGSKYVTFQNKINILGVHLNGVVITRDDDIWITSKCKYERHEWVHATFLPIPGGLNFTEEGFGQLEVRLSMFPTRQYQRPYRANQYPIHLKLRQQVYMQLEVQGHGQNLSVLALNCKATMSPEPNDTLQYQLINDGCASDPTLKIYNINDNSKERFGLEAFRFIREVKTVYVHCEVIVCNAADSGSRCAQGCVSRGKRDAGEKVDMRGRHMIYQGPIVLDDDKEAANTLRLVNDEETATDRRSAPWAALAAGGGLVALALAVLGAAIVLKRSRREKWAYQGLPDMEEDGE